MLFFYAIHCTINTQYVVACTHISNCRKPNLYAAGNGLMRSVYKGKQFASLGHNHQEGRTIDTFFQKAHPWVMDVSSPCQLTRQLVPHSCVCTVSCRLECGVPRIGRNASDAACVCRSVSAGARTAHKVSSADLDHWSMTFRFMGLFCGPSPCAG